MFLVDVASCNCSLAKSKEIAEEIFSPSRSGGFWTRKAERLIVAFIRERWGKQFSKITLKLSETLGYRHIEIFAFNPFSSKIAMVGTWSPELSSFSAQSLQNIFPKFDMKGFKKVKDNLLSVQRQFPMHVCIDFAWGMSRTT